MTDSMKKDIQSSLITFRKKMTKFKPISYMTKAAIVGENLLKSLAVCLQNAYNYSSESEKK